MPEQYSVDRAIQESIDKYRAELEKVLYNLDNKLIVPSTPALAEHRRLQAEKAFKPISEFCQNILEQGKQLVLFGHHRGVLSSYVEKFKK